MFCRLLTPLPSPDLFVVSVVALYAFALTILLHPVAAIESFLEVGEGGVWPPATASVPSLGAEPFPPPSLEWALRQWPLWGRGQARGADWGASRVALPGTRLGWASPLSQCGPRGLLPRRCSRPASECVVAPQLVCVPHAWRVTVLLLVMANAAVSMLVEVSHGSRSFCWRGGRAGSPTTGPARPPQKGGGILLSPLFRNGWAASSLAVVGT